jgi:hypothetical protein
MLNFYIDEGAFFVKKNKFMCQRSENNRLIVLETEISHLVLERVVFFEQLSYITEIWYWPKVRDFR